MFNQPKVVQVEAMQHDRNSKTQQNNRDQHLLLLRQVLQ
jgi:hypothetical protein